VLACCGWVSVCRVPVETEWRSQCRSVPTCLSLPCALLSALFCCCLPRRYADTDVESNTWLLRALPWIHGDVSLITLTSPAPGCGGGYMSATKLRDSIPGDAWKAAGVAEPTRIAVFGEDGKLTADPATYFNAVLCVSGAREGMDMLALLRVIYKSIMTRLGINGELVCGALAYACACAACVYGCAHCV
jgi:hypothetical protein